MIICEALPFDEDTPGSIGELLGTDHSLDLISTVGGVVSIRILGVIGDWLDCGGSGRRRHVVTWDDRDTRGIDDRSRHIVVVEVGSGERALA